MSTGDTSPNGCTISQRWSFWKVTVTAELHTHYRSLWGCYSLFMVFTFNKLSSSHTHRSLKKKKKSNNQFSSPLKCTQSALYNHRGHVVAFKMLWNETSTISSWCVWAGFTFQCNCADRERAKSMTFSNVINIAACGVRQFVRSEWRVPLDWQNEWTYFSCTLLAALSLFMIFHACVCGSSQFAIMLMAFCKWQKKCYATAGLLGVWWWHTSGVVI